MRRQAGLTLLEILVVLAVIGLVTAILVIGIGRAGKLTLRTDASRVAAALRSAFDRAAATGAHHRVVIDLDAETFQVERCEGRIRLRRSEDQAKAQAQAELAAQLAQLKAQAQAQAEASALGLPPGAPPPTTGTPPPAEPPAEVGEAGCAPMSGEQGKPQALKSKKQIGFRRVFVSHLEKVADEGKVTINFFPLGRAEKAVIEIGEGDEDLLSIVVEPLSGRVHIQSGEWKHPEDFVAEDATGEEQFE